MSTSPTPTPHLPRDDSTLEVEFAKAALTGALADPTCNPTTADAIDETVDFCWYIAQRMVARRPKKGTP